MTGRRTTPEKPPSRRELTVAGKELSKKRATSAEKTLAGRVLSEGAAVRRRAVKPKR
jgi:hypothetical protein